ncbi:MAG: hypothetical protein JSS35_03690, partial [Proteobacteria bacterium]|nr:hypothetical protein [Pseudomonadota bacterium]
MAAGPVEQDSSAHDAAAEAIGLLSQAEAHLEAQRLDLAVDAAARAAAMNARPDLVLPALARIFEARDEPLAALEAHTRAMAAAPEAADISLATARLALRLRHFTTAEQAFQRTLSQVPGVAEVIADLSRAQAGQRAYARAQATLSTALEAQPAAAPLWQALGELLALQGAHAQAIVFFEESLRLDPKAPTALDGLAEALLLGGGDEDRAISASEEALLHAAPRDLPALTESHARRLLSLGRLEAGWAAFRQGVGSGDPASVIVKAAAPRLEPGVELEGRLLLFGETDVVDELLLALMLPELIDQGVAPVLAIGAAWMKLARRSFPGVPVVDLMTRVDAGRRLLAADLDSPHVHGGELIGAWATLRDMLAMRRTQLGDFTQAKPYGALKPDPERVRHWREYLASLGPEPKVGLAWRMPGSAAR